MGGAQALAVTAATTAKITIGYRCCRGSVQYRCVPRKCERFALFNDFLTSISPIPIHMEICVLTTLTTEKLNLHKSLAQYSSCHIRRCQKVSLKCQWIDAQILFKNKKPAAKTIIECFVCGLGSIEFACEGPLTKRQDFLCSTKAFSMHYLHTCSNLFWGANSQTPVKYSGRHWVGCQSIKMSIHNQWNTANCLRILM